MPGSWGLGHIGIRKSWRPPSSKMAAGAPRPLLRSCMQCSKLITKRRPANSRPKRTRWRDCAEPLQPGDRNVRTLKIEEILEGLRLAASFRGFALVCYQSYRNLQFDDGPAGR